MSKPFNISREIVGKLAPFFLILSFPLHIFLIFVDSSYDSIKVFKNPSYLLMLFGLAFLGLYFIFNIIKYAHDLKHKINPQEDEFFKIGKGSNWAIKHHNLIKLISSCVCLISLIFPVLIALCKIKSFYFFQVYFAVWVALAVILICYLFNALFYSKNKTTFIISVVALSIMLAFLIVSAIYVFDMYFGFSNNKRMADIFLALASIPIVILQFKDTAYDDIKKSKRGVNFLLGVITLLVAIVIVVAKNKCIFYLEDYIARNGTANLIHDAIPYVNILLKVLKWLFFAIVVSTIANWTFGLRYYIKRKDVIGFVDLAASASALLVSFFAISKLISYLVSLI